MTDEVSSSMHIAVTVWCAGALISIVSGILIMSLALLNNYGTTYSNAIVSTTNSSIFATVQEEPQSGAIIYSKLQNSIDVVASITIKDKKNNSTLLYRYNNVNYQNDIQLMTIYKNNLYKVTLQKNSQVYGLYDVYLQEVDR